MQPLVFRLLLILFCCGFFHGNSQENVVTYTKADGLTSTQITASLVDSKGIVWFGTNYGLNVYTGNKWIPIKNIEDNDSGNPRPLGTVNIIFEDLKRNIWVSTDQGLFFYNRKYWTFYEPQGDKEYSSKIFLQDRSGGVWITLEYFQDLADDMGFSLVSGKLQFYKNNKWFKFDNDLAGTSSVSLKDPTDYFTSIFQDRKGRLWFATLEGAFVFDGKDWTSYKKDDLDAKKVYDLIEDSKGQFWAATENGVSYLNSGKWTNFTKKDGLIDNSVYKLVEDATGRKWAFSRNDMRFAGLSMYENGIWKAFDAGDIQLKGEIEKLILQDSNVIAFSKYGVSMFEKGQWHKFEEKSGLIDKSYSMIVKDRRKTIWLAGDQGFYKYHEGVWELLLNQNEKWDVQQIYRDKKGRIWVGTEKSGLFVYNEGDWDTYNENNGLADDHILKIFEDRHGNIWVTTRKEIVRISDEQLAN